MAALMTAILAGASGCGDPARGPAPLPPDAVPIPAGPAPRWRPPPRAAAAVAAGREVAGLRCTTGATPRVGVFLELIVHRRVVVVPAGVGTARDCSYPVRTRGPTGVLEVEAGARLRLGHAFALWGQALGPRRLASFRGRVRAYVGGRAWRGDPRAIPLRRHAVIVLQLGEHVPPHPRYAFPAGL
jgi:hypothetical protein